MHMLIALYLSFYYFFLDCDMVFQASLTNAEYKFQQSYKSVEEIMQAGHVIIGIATLLYGPCSLKMVIFYNLY